MNLYSTLLAAPAYSLFIIYKYTVLVNDHFEPERLGTKLDFKSLNNMNELLFFIRGPNKSNRAPPPPQKIKVIGDIPNPKRLVLGDLVVYLVQGWFEIRKKGILE